MKRTKIVCTIGPASDNKNILKKLVKNGMNVARLNFSHNIHSYHGKVMKTIRTIAREEKLPIAILQDLQGPRIRLGKIDEPIKLKKSQKIILTTSNVKSADKIPVTYKQMHQDVKADQRILIADGLIELKVEKVFKQDIYCRVVNPGILISNKGINLPDTDVQVPALSEKDRKDLLFGLKNNVDYVGLSFVRTAEEVYQLKSLIKQYEKKLKLKPDVPIRVIVKIERKEAITNIDPIIDASDGVMVARGDLGIELPAEDVPLMQKMIIDKCLKAVKPVIVATQMLESMIINPRPTRAEVSDVANAVIDHTDAVMLSGETASGKYPVETVEIMSKIIEKTEASEYDDLILRDKIKMMKSTNEAMSQVTKFLVEHTKAKLILCSTLSGYVGRIISRYRPEMPIYVGTTIDRVYNQLNLSWGTIPFKISAKTKPKDLEEKGKLYLKKHKIIKKKDKIILVCGLPIKTSDKIKAVELEEI